jgi:hypothetical protein
MEVTTVGALREYLSQFHDDTMIVGTWESVVNRIHVYHSKNGVVIIDADEGHYQEPMEAKEITSLPPW